MSRNRWWARGALVMAAASLVVAAVACGGNGDKDSGAKTSASSVSGPSGSITIVATDNKYDKTELKVKANTETTLVFENKGTAIHNIKVINAKSTDGKEIGTQLLAGGKSETVMFTIDKPGTYDYHCETHPTEMKGKLTVQ